MVIKQDIQVDFKGDQASVSATYAVGNTEISVKTVIKINPTGSMSVAQLREAPRRIALDLLNKLPVTSSEPESQ